MDTPEQVADRAAWVPIASYATGLDADMARSTLESANIPVLVRGNAPGIFGLAYQGNVAGGITLHVPTPEVSRARELLDGLDTDDAFGDDDAALSP